MLARLTPLQTLIVFLGCLVAIIVAHRLSPGAVALVASLSGTVVAALLRPPGAVDPPAPPSPPASPGGGAPPDPPPTVPEGRGPRMLALIFAASLVGCLGGRTAADVVAEDAAYKAELAACELQAGTCLGYVACRKRAAEGHGRKYNGRCVP